MKEERSNAVVHTARTDGRGSRDLSEKPLRREGLAQTIHWPLDRRRAGRDVLLREKCGPPRDRKPPAEGSLLTATDEPDGK